MKKRFLVGLVTGLLVFGLIGMANAVVINNLELPEGAEGQYIEILETQTPYYAIGTKLSFDIYNYSDIILDSFFVGLNSEAVEDFGWYFSSERQSIMTDSQWDAQFEVTYGAWNNLFTEDEYTYEYVLYGQFGEFFGAWSAQTDDFGFVYGDMLAMSSPVVFSGTDANGNATIITGQTSHQLGQNPITVGTGPAPVPEPATVLLFGTGLIGLAAFKRRKK